MKARSDRLRVSASGGLLARILGFLMGVVGILAGAATCYLAFLMADHQFLQETFSNSIVGGVPGAIVPLALYMTVFGVGLWIIGTVVGIWVSEIRESRWRSGRWRLHH